MSETFEEHLNLVNRGLRLERNGIKIEYKKCTFFQSGITGLGHTISQQGISQFLEYIQTVQDCQTNYHHPIETIFRTLNFEQKCIQNCSVIAKPLTDITRVPKCKIIQWTEDVQAYNKLKKEIAKEVSLSNPNYAPWAGDMELSVDISGYGAGTTQIGSFTTEREVTTSCWALVLLKHFLWCTLHSLY